MSDDMTPRERAIDNAGRVWAAGCARQTALTPREAVEEAYVPDGEYVGASVEQIQAKIRAQRGLPTPGPPRSHRHVSADRLRRGGTAASSS